MPQAVLVFVLRPSPLPILGCAKLLSGGGLRTNTRTACYGGVCDGVRWGEMGPSYRQKNVKLG